MTTPQPQPQQPYAQQPYPQPRTSAPLSRPRHGAMIGGVCAALARHFNTSPTTVRLLAIVSCLLPGPQVVAYIVLWVVLPRDPA